MLKPSVVNLWKLLSSGAYKITDQSSPLKFRALGERISDYERDQRQELQALCSRFVEALEL